MENPLNINVNRFWKSAGTGIVGLIALLLTLLVTGALLRVFPITGIGEYVVAAEKIEGTHFILFPELHPQDNEESLPIAVVKLGHATIDGLILKKNVDLNAVLDLYGISNIDIIATSSKGVRGGDLNLKVTGLHVEDPQLDNLQVAEDNPDDSLREIDLTASELVLRNAEIYTHFMNARDIEINPLGLKVKVMNNPQ